MHIQHVSCTDFKNPDHDLWAVMGYLLWQSVKQWLSVVTLYRNKVYLADLGSAKLGNNDWTVSDFCPCLCRVMKRLLLYRTNWQLHGWKRNRVGMDCISWPRHIGQITFLFDHRALPNCYIRSRQLFYISGPSLVDFWGVRLLMFRPWGRKEGVSEE